MYTDDLSVIQYFGIVAYGENMHTPSNSNKVDMVKAPNILFLLQVLVPWGVVSINMEFNYPLP